ncbi:MAG: transposase [Acidithiobacillus sp.]
MAERIREMIREICEAFEICIVKGVVGKNHVHIMASCPPTMARVRLWTNQRPHFEQVDRWISASIKEVLGHICLGERIFFATLGQMTEEMIKHYFDPYFEENPNLIFKMETD